MSELSDRIKEKARNMLVRVAKGLDDEQVMPNGNAAALLRNAIRYLKRLVPSTSNDTMQDYTEQLGSDPNGFVKRRVDLDNSSDTSSLGGASSSSETATEADLDTENVGDVGGSTNDANITENNPSLGKAALDDHIRESDSVIKFLESLNDFEENADASSTASEEQGLSDMTNGVGNLTIN